MPWITIALIAVAASLTTRIDAVFATGDALSPAVSPPVPPHAETRVGAVLAGDLQTQAKTAERARALELRAAMVEAAEKRIDDKLQQLSSSADTARRPDGRPVRRIVARSEGEPAMTSGDERITALVKMYQAMRPKDAARIFERLDIDVQVDVASHMRERAAAAILAEMDPKAASRLTMALAGFAPEDVDADTL